MNKIIKMIHVMLITLSLGIFLLSLLRLIIVWNTLPDRIGVHFSSTGEFDVFDSKRYIAYPYLIALFAIILVQVITYFIWKIPTGMKISEAKEAKIKSAFQLLIDFSGIGYVFFYAGVWTDCVIRQNPLDTHIPQIILLFIFLMNILFFIYIIVIRIRKG